jgi:glycosyltransferase involved in cell wall biosynthesis
VKTLSVVVPVYFNEQSLPALFEKMLDVERQLGELGLALELIFVDDGSQDDSWKVLLSLRERRPATRLIKLSRNFGAVQASKAGYRYVTGDCFVTLAADLQDPPDVIVEMAKHWLAGSRFVISERARRDDPLVSRFFSFVYYKMLHALVMRDYPAGGFDMALMDRAMQAPMVNSAKNVFTPLLAFWLGFTPAIIKYDRPKREHGRSRWTFSRKFKTFIDVMLGFSVTPIRIMSAIGVLVAAVSFSYGSAVFLWALFRGVEVPGFATLVALITFLQGLIILMLGIIGEYLWRIFDQTNKRPEVVIETEL